MARGKPSRLRVVFAATDFSPAARRAVARAELLARWHRARLVLFNTLEIGAESLEAMGGDPADLARYFRSQLKREVTRALSGAPLGRRIEADFRFGKPFVEIISAAREAGADLIVVGARGAAGMRRPGLGGTAEKVVRKADLPVLVVRHPARGSYAKVLVAVDFSEHSRHALEMAVRVAPGAELHLVHAYGLLAEVRLVQAARRGLLPPGFSQDALTRRDRVQNAMAEFVSAIELGDREPHLHLEKGAPERVLPAAVRSARIGLLALGTHGRTGLAHALLGSVAERAVRDVGCDVLVARTGIHAFRMP